LRLGTAADNAKDRDTKGRSGYTKLTDLDVQEIKRLHASGVSIMRIKGEFGVGRRAVERALGRGR
jgi:IS30 family transposase